MDDLVRRLREAAEQMKKGVYGPGQVAVIREAADVIEAHNRGVMVRIETEDDREFRDYCCPCCGVTISQEYKGPVKLRPGLYRPKWCADCGQALLWPERKVENADI